MPCRNISNGESCEQCRFWARQGKKFAGECRRYPPHYAEGSLGRPLELKRVYPMVPPTDWCGEFRPRVAELL